MANAANYDALKNKQAELIRKATDGSVFIGPGSAAAITALTVYTAAVVGPPAIPEKWELKELPAGYEDLGHLTNDGAQFGRDVTTSNITSWGSVSPTRSDITADTTTLQVAAQETKLTSLAVATGADLAAITANATSKEVVIKKPVRPSSRVWRALMISVDENASGEIWIARFLPRAKVTSYSAQNFGGGDNAIEWGVTFTGEPDSDLGYSEAWFFGGPGWAAILTDMEIPLAA